MRNASRALSRSPESFSQGITIQSVERAARLLLAVATRKTNGSCKALAVASGLAIPTAHHLLNTLVTTGLLARDSTAHYLLGPEIAVLGEAYQRESAVPEYLLTPLHQLADATGESTYFGGWRLGTMQIFAMAEGYLPVRVSLPSQGRYRDAHARAAGKALLAYAPDSLREGYLMSHPFRAVTPNTITDPAKFNAELRRVRANGYATECEEFLEGIGCISVPVLHSGALIGAYSMLIPMQRFADRHQEIIRSLLAAAGDVERRLRGRPRVAGSASNTTVVASDRTSHLTGASL